MTRIGLVLFLLAPQGSSAEELFKSMKEKIDAAKTIRMESTMSTGEGPAAFFSRTTVKVKGSDRWVYDYELRSGGIDGRVYQKCALTCNGRRIAVRGKAEGLNRDGLRPGEWAVEFRHSVSSVYMNHSLFSVRGGEGKPPVRSPIRDGGKAEVGDRAARILDYSITYDWPGIQDVEMKVRVTVDIGTKLPLRREVIWFGQTWKEEISVLVLDEEIPDSDFGPESKKGVARAQAAQLAASVRLFGLYTGRHPETLEDLLKRPAGLEASVFWPARGFLLGGAVPRDPWGEPFGLVSKGGRLSVVSRGEGGEVTVEVPPVTRRAVGAPSDRLQKFYSARVEVQLLAAAVRGYRDAYGELPKKKAALWEKPEWAEVWPEGGWIPKVPDDPWGDPYRIISDADFVRVQVKDPKAVALGAKSLSAEERGKLDEAARPRLTEGERRAVARLLDQLGDDDLDARERAEGELKGWGSVIAALIDERLKQEKEGEVALRLAAVRKAIPARRAAWMSELGPLSVMVRVEDASEGVAGGDERRVVACLKTLATAQADFRSNDRDNNKVNDFWTGDVASLYTLVPEGGKEAEAIKLIELGVAAADGAPLDEGAVIEKLAEREPKAGYWFRAMLKDNSSGTPVDYRQETAGKAGALKARNPSAFAFCAYPAEYGVTGTRTYIINEGNVIFSKDTGGEPILEWPSDDQARGWLNKD